VEAAQSEVTIHFDADCRIPDPTSLLDWMIDTLESRGDVCYSPVKFYDCSSQLSVRTKLGIHHAARWAKRNLFRIPTTRGSNYAIRRSWFLRLYAEGKLSVDMQVGQAAKLAGARVVYCADSRLAVLTSGRRFRGGWLKMPRYFLYRLRYNLHAVPVKGREVTRTSWSGFDQESQTRTHTH
jgi:hypothetical protein